MDDFVKVDRICKLLGVSRMTVHNWINEKGLPFLKVGGALRFEEKAVVDWFRSQKEGD